MKIFAFFLCPLVLLFGFTVFMKNSSAPVDRFSLTENLNRNIIECSPSGEGNFTVAADGKFITLLPGWGNHAYHISTTTDSAQVYFNQGLSMYYSYHAREATASFKEAARWDSSCAMAYWAQALSMGPSYNFGYMYKLNKSIPSVINKMNSLASTASPRERALIAAMNKRYNIADTADTERSSLNTAYVEAMKAVMKSYPDDLDIKALYTDAVMLVHSWDFWYNDGRPKSWTRELVQYCEDILKKNAHHPAALHYYIHVTEASRNPEVALPGADSLIKLFPGIAHMVHMSSHEYERIGYYAKGVDANEKADSSLILYDSLARGLYPTVHAPHYFAVDAYCALSGGMYKKAKSKCEALRSLVQPAQDKMYLQYQYMYPSLANVRLGKWQEILADTTSIDQAWTFAGLLDNFAKGMAYVRTGSAANAEKQLAQLREKQKDKMQREKFAPHTSSPAECAVVAEHILAANIHFLKGDHAAAISAINSAIVAEDRLLYSEPKMWMIPARQYLGKFYLAMKLYGKAEKVYRDDLVWNPGNGWSLLGLHQSLSLMKKSRELSQLKARYKVSFSHADEMPPGSAY